MPLPRAPRLAQPNCAVSSTPQPRERTTDENPLRGRSGLSSLSDPSSLREFARNLREGIYITTRDGRILDANPAFLEMLGIRSLAELHEYTAQDLLLDAGRSEEHTSELQSPYV